YILLLLILSLRPPPLSLPFPYTTLFRSAQECWLHVCRRATITGALQIARVEHLFDLSFDRHREHGFAQVHAFAHQREAATGDHGDRKSTRLNSSHVKISYAVFCLKKKKR